MINFRLVPSQLEKSLTEKHVLIHFPEYILVCVKNYKEINHFLNGQQEDFVDGNISIKNM